MPRYKLTLAYDGADFCGWQKQFPHEDAVTGAPRMDAFAEDQADQPPPPPLGGAAGEEIQAPRESEGVSPASPARPRVELRTVQSVLERAVRAVVHQPVVIHGASRTDSGVHANGQVAAFSTIVEDDARGRGGWPVERGVHGLVRAINSRLPRDVLVLSAEPVADDFDPISGARSKGYTYTIWNASERTLWLRNTTLHVWQPLDVARMQAAAAVLVGEHDFAAFAAAGHGRATTVRTVHECTVERRTANELSGPPSHQASRPGQLIRISVSGSGFLWNMVRIIAGTLVEAGKGKLTPNDIREALATGDRRKAGPTLPPHGLCLEWIRYDDRDDEPRTK
jgi:tRNA pseudouridine38-40 synthase